MASKSKRGRSSRSKKESPGLNELLVLELQEIHSAESQLARVLPRISKSAESGKLQECLDERLKQGEQLIEDIENALEEMEESPGRKKNVAAEGLINDMREHVQEIEQGPALDTVLIAAIQKTEHYCIAAWGTARALAQALEQESVVESMERALGEGKSMDEQLTQLAESEITPSLMSSSEAGGDEDEEDDEGEEASSGAARGGRSGGNKRSERRPAT
jgi:ferritin-like metal-binding protein YciE